MIKTEGIILKKSDLGETDRLLTIYTKDFGKIKVLAKGVKKLNSKLRYHLEPLNYSYLILIEGKNFRIIKDAVLMDQFLNIRQDLKKTGVIFELMKLLDELIIDEEQDENIWTLCLITLQQLNRGGQLSSIIRNFRNNLINLLGYDSNQVKTSADIY